MCRKGDAGPYALGNVFIATNSENSSMIVAPGREAKVLPMGVRRQLRGGGFYATKRQNGVQHHIGTFKTPELAREAYINFVAPGEA